MREIKFRSFVERTDSTGRLNSYSYMNYELEFHGSVNEIFAQSGIKPLNPLHNKITYMQYTGLKDKNGKEIYEGDIVYFTVFNCFDADEQYKGVVKFAKGQWEIWNNAKSEFYGSDGAFDLWWVNQQDDEFEIIGNIYENPELLEGTE